MTKLKPVTLEDIRQLYGEEKFEAMNRYIKWRDKQRTQDKKEVRNLYEKVKRFLESKEENGKTKRKECNL